MTGTPVPAADREVERTDNLPTPTTDLAELQVLLGSANVDLERRIAEIEGKVFGVPLTHPDGRPWLEDDGTPKLKAKPVIPDKPLADEETAGRVTEFIRLVRGAHGLADDRHDQHKRPFLEAGKFVDGFYNRLIERLARCRAPLQKMADDWEAEKLRRVREKDAERAKLYEAAKLPPPPPVDRPPPTRGAYGGTSTAREDWVAEIENIEKIPLAKLRKHLKREWIEQALRAHIAASKKIDPKKEPPPITGVKFVRKVRADIR